MMTQQMIEKLVDDLSAILKAKFDSAEYDETYRRVVGRDRDPMLKIGEMQYAAGAIFMGAYFAKCGQENPDKRLTPCLREIVPVADKKIIGFALQGNQVMQAMSKLMSNGAFMFAVDAIPEWRNAPATVKKFMAARINSLTMLAGSLAPSLANDLGKKFAFGAEFNDVFDAFMTKFDAFLDEAYGVYVPPPPPPKKGFWGSLFG